MPSPAAIRAAERVLARMGQPSTLDGAEGGFVHLEHGASVVQNDVVLLKTVATISRRFAPAPGRILVHPDGVFELDVLFQTNGANDRYLLLPVTS